jgi:glutathione synthase/RimK-type ligase-like ATP-grasp enzyme
MALVLSSAGLQQLQDQLPTPALVQEFVNHGGQQYKVYVMGEQVCASSTTYVLIQVD